MGAARVHPRVLVVASRRSPSLSAWHPAHSPFASLTARQVRGPPAHWGWTPEQPFGIEGKRRSMAAIFLIDRTFEQFLQKVVDAVLKVFDRYLLADDLVGYYVRVLASSSAMLAHLPCATPRLAPPPSAPDYVPRCTPPPRSALRTVRLTSSQGLGDRWLFDVQPKGEGEHAAALREQIVNSVTKSGEPHVYSSMSKCVSHLANHVDDTYSKWLVVLTDTVRRLRLVGRKRRARLHGAFAMTRSRAIRYSSASGGLRCFPDASRLLSPASNVRPPASHAGRWTSSALAPKEPSTSSPRRGPRRLWLACWSRRAA